MRELLSDFDVAKAIWVDQILQERWLQDGDKGSKLFFKTFRGLAAAKQILALLNAEGNSI